MRQTSFDWFYMQVLHSIDVSIVWEYSYSSFTHLCKCNSSPNFPFWRIRAVVLQICYCPDLSFFVCKKCWQIPCMYFSTCQMITFAFEAQALRDGQSRSRDATFLPSVSDLDCAGAKKCPKDSRCICQKQSWSCSTAVVFSNITEM